MSYSLSMRAFLIRSLLHLSAQLPLAISHRLALFIGWLLTIIPNDIRRITRINLQLCFPHMTAMERSRLEHNCLTEMVKTGLEMGPMWLWSQPRSLGLIKQVHGHALLEQAIHLDKGVILAIPHIGMWELLGLYVSSHYSMTSLYRPPRLTALNNIMRKGRERFGARLVPTSTRGIRELYKALGQGELVAILPDQEPRWGNGVFAPFFGLPAYTATLLPRIAAKSGATMLLAYAIRRPYGEGFDLHFREVNEACYSSDPIQAASALNREIEQCVREQPEQYQWHYRRFRTRPENDPRSYYRRNK